MKIDAVTIFPEYFEPLKLSLLGKAQETGLVEFGIHDLRTFATNVHNQHACRPLELQREVFLQFQEDP